VTQQQYMDALARANKIRFARGDAKRDVYEGRLSFADALYLECCQSMRVLELLMAQHRWGEAKARKLIGVLRLSHDKRIDELTGRQRRALIAAVGDRRTAA
jgi:hypothetical protein